MSSRSVRNLEFGPIQVSNSKLGKAIAKEKEKPRLLSKPPRPRPFALNKTIKWIEIRSSLQMSHGTTEVVRNDDKVLFKSPEDATRRKSISSEIASYTRGIKKSSAK